MTPAERDEVRRRASDRLADHSMATVTSDERCACDRCDDDRAVLRYVPPGDAAAVEAFKALRFDCRRCGADLLGADLATRADSDPNSPWQCPRCNHFAVEEIDAMTEAAP